MKINPAKLFVIAATAALFALPAYPTQGQPKSQTPVSLKAEKELVFRYPSDAPIAPVTMEIDNAKTRLFIPHHVKNVINQYRIEENQAFIVFDQEISLGGKDEKKPFARFISIDSDPQGEKLRVINYSAQKISTVQLNPKDGAYSEEDSMPLPFRAYASKIDTLRNIGYFAGFEKSEKSDKWFEIISVNFNNNAKHYLVQSHEKYFLTPEVFKKENESQNLGAIGIKSLLDFYNNMCYTAWEGDYRVIAADSENPDGKMVFNAKPKYYKKPNASELIDDYKNKRFDKVIDARKQFTYMRGLFASESSIFAVFEMMDKGNSLGNAIATKFSIVKLDRRSGTFQKEYNPVHGFSSIMAFDKESSSIYTLVTSSGSCKVVRYKL